MPLARALEPGQRPIRGVLGPSPGAFGGKEALIFLLTVGGNREEAGPILAGPTTNSPCWGSGGSPQVGVLASPAGRQPLELPEPLMPQCESSPVRGQRGSQEAGAHRAAVGIGS